MSETTDTEVLIVGAGAAGLILALSLHEIGVDCRVYEAVKDIREVGAGINLLPHAVKELDQLDLVPALDEVGIRTKDASYFNHHGQLIFTEPAGEAAGYPWPQFSLHRGDMQVTFLNAVLERLGPDSVVTDRRCTHVTQDEDGATAHFIDKEGNEQPSARGKIVVGCDGINSVIRKQFYPDEGEPRYSGLTIWRGVTPWQPMLSGANTVRIGWMDVGKLMVYPIRDDIDDEGNQLMNFVATLERPRPDSYDWNSDAKLEDFYEPYADWHFDWLDVPELLDKPERYLVFPMVDRDPLPTWTFDRITMMGDAAHPMYPRGSNGAGQSILDARFMAGCIKRHGVTKAAMQEYDAERVEATGRVVLRNRAAPPDRILQVVHERTNGQPFDDIDDVISQEELQAISDDYKKVAGFEIDQLKARPAFV
ncbi:MAG: flavin-dependent oxidoreductase [Nitriliruptoraceae bacterium]|nr:flavin-dependent oxidoreductase [Nitriliruptoraceae bacterium]